MLVNPIFQRFFVVGDYFIRQRNVSIKERMTVVDWLVEVQETFELNHETLYLSVKLMDRYLDRVADVKLEKLQLVASAAAFVASKFDVRIFTECLLHFEFMITQGDDTFAIYQF